MRIAMRRPLALLALILTLGTLVGSAGALRCDCCASSAAPTLDAADFCCPNGSAVRCGSRALSPSPSVRAAAILAEARPAVLPDVTVSPRGSMLLVNLRAEGAKPSGRDGLAMRSILRI
jgi:hypothetical protein